MVVHYRNDSFSRVFAVRHRQLDIPVRLYQNHSQSLTVIGVSPAFTVADYIIGAGTTQPKQPPAGYLHCEDTPFQWLESCVVLL